MARNRILDEHVRDLADRQHGAFTLDQLEGVADRRVASARVRRGEWHRFLPGTYCLRGHLDEWTGPAALCLHVPEAVVGFTASARWWRLDGIVDAPVRLLAPYACRSRVANLSRTDDLLPWEVRAEDDGCLRFTDPTRTLIDLGAVLPATNLERAVESAVRQGLSSVARLRARARQLRRPGKAGPGKLLAALDRRPRGGTDSDGETIFWQLLCAAGLPGPVRQHRIGRWRFDLAWPDLRIAVELDGRTHRDATQLRRDDRKQNDAVLAGWTVLRFTWDRIQHEPEQVIAELTAAIALAASRSS